MKKQTNRPFFYTNFVQTVDGKTQVLKNTADYWPIGSKNDHDVLMELRAHADCLIHGRRLAEEFGQVTLKSLQDNSFKKLRKKLGKNTNLPYYGLTRSPVHCLEVPQIILGSSLNDFAKSLYNKGYQNVLVEGGPTLLGSFLKENLIDEIYLTIVPKIFGNLPGKTLSLVEGVLFPADKTKQLRLLSVKKIGDEVFLRYKVSS